MRTTRRIAFAIVIVTLVALTGGVWVSGAPDVPQRADQAWTDRLNGQAQAAAERAVADGRRQRADAAYALRLTEQARAYLEERSRDRATQAWIDRLNGLAESLNADQ
jgi:hypothetical protein